MNDPFELSDKVPCVEFVCSVAVNGLFSMSVSFVSIPGAGMFSVVSSDVI